jgi:hypothetical protein
MPRLVKLGYSGCAFQRVPAEAPLSSGSHEAGRKRKRPPSLEMAGVIELPFAVVKKSPPSAIPTPGFRGPLLGSPSGARDTTFDGLSDIVDLPIDYPEDESLDMSGAFKDSFYDDIAKKMYDPHDLVMDRPTFVDHLEFKRDNLLLLRKIRQIATILYRLENDSWGKFIASCPSLKRPVIFSRLDGYRSLVTEMNAQNRDVFAKLRRSLDIAPREWRRSVEHIIKTSGRLQFHINDMMKKINIQEALFLGPR